MLADRLERDHAILCEIRFKAAFKRQPVLAIGAQLRRADEAGDFNNIEALGKALSRGLICFETQFFAGGRNIRRRDEEVKFRLHFVCHLNQPCQALARREHRK